MTGTNSSNDRLILRRNVEINSNWYYSYGVFSGMKSWTTWNGNAIAQSPRNMSEFRDVSNTSDIRFLVVCRTIIDVILHLFIICNDLWCQLPFFSQTFRHNGSAVFDTMPPMCRSCPDVNKLRGMDTTILGQHRPFMSIKSFVQHSGWQEMVSLCSLIRLIGVCADRDQPEFLCSRSDSDSSPCGHSGRLVNSLSPTWGKKLNISISENPYRLSIGIFISIYIANIDNLRQHWCKCIGTPKEKRVMWMVCVRFCWQNCYHQGWIYRNSHWKHLLILSPDMEPFFKWYRRVLM